MNENEKFVFKPKTKGMRAANDNQLPSGKERGTFTPVQKDALFLVYEAERITRDIIPKIEECTTHIFSLADFKKDDKNIKLRREGLKEWSLEQICNAIVAGGTQQWNQYPSYYGALILEFETKKAAALTLIPDDSAP